MKDLPASIRRHAEELRKVRLSQRWSSCAEALEQCKLVEARAAAVSSGKPKRSASGPVKRIFTVEECDEPESCMCGTEPKTKSKMAPRQTA